MARVRIVATKEQRYGRRVIARGEVFEVRPDEALLLKALKRAEDVPVADVLAQASEVREDSTRYRWPEANAAHEAYRAAVETPQPPPPPVIPDEHRELDEPMLDPPMPFDQPYTETDEPSDEPEAATVRRRRKYQRRDMVAED